MKGGAADRRGKPLPPWAVWALGLGCGLMLAWRVAAATTAALFPLTDAGAWTLP